MKVIALISGGLDSLLAARLMQEQGCKVLPLYFKIPFCHQGQKENDIATQVKNNLGTDLESIDISAEFLSLLNQPEHGFGANMNPCIDCKILMLRKGQIMAQNQAAFVVTGEVLGQRPMSQHRQALEKIAQAAGLTGLLLRPLSAQILEPTIPEKEGWVDRQKLPSFNGRTRQPQIALAKSLGITDYAQPAGGCLLTDPRFSDRLKELITHQELSLANVELLKFGRHFRLAPKTKLVVGRNEKENNTLLALAGQQDYIFMPTEEIAGATALGRGGFDQDLIELASSLVCRYCDLEGKSSNRIVYRRQADKEAGEVLVSPLEDADLSRLRI